MEADLRAKLSHLPNKPGAYMMKDDAGKVIYVGKASSLRGRVRSYFQKGQTHSAKVAVLVSRITDIDWIVTESEIEALMLECNLIKRHRPKYNVRLRDDKHYPYLCVTTSEPFPRVLVVRRVKQDGNKYYGPYADSAAMRESLRLIRKVFRIRGCNKKLTGGERDRPCLNLHLGHCDSPCSGAISREEYAELVKDATLFLEGRRESLAERLEREMTSAADDLEFERAARLRDQVESIRRTIERQKAISTGLADQDIIAVSTDSASACVQVLLVRSGKLVGEEHFFLEGVADESSESILGEFVKQFYRDATHVPREVLVSHLPPESDVIEDWLSLKRGSRVKVIHPKRGEKRKLVEMAAENAILAADRERSRAYKAEDEAAKDLEALREVLHLSEIPARIETYDISNIQGREAVGSMVVFERGVPAKSQYRRFKIRTGESPDDYGMMREVLMRRFAQAKSGDPKFSSLPDLILVDGGRGQLNAAVAAMADGQWSMGDGQTGHEPSAIRESAETGDCRRETTDPEEASESAVCRLQSTVPVVSLAKRLEEVYTADSAEPMLLPRESPALRLLQRMRDEAHRFAVAYHHKLREKTVRKSVLDEIPGIGPTRRKSLIRKFGSAAGVRRASVEELLSVPGMSRSVAQAVYDALNP